MVLSFSYSLSLSLVLFLSSSLFSLCFILFLFLFLCFLLLFHSFVFSFVLHPFSLSQGFSLFPLSFLCPCVLIFYLWGFLSLIFCPSLLYLFHLCISYPLVLFSFTPFLSSCLGFLSFNSFSLSLSLVFSFVPPEAIYFKLGLAIGRFQSPFFGIFLFLSFLLPAIKHGPLGRNKIGKSHQSLAVGIGRVKKTKT